MKLQNRNDLIIEIAHSIADMTNKATEERVIGLFSKSTAEIALEVSKLIYIEAHKIINLIETKGIAE